MTKTARFIPAPEMERRSNEDLMKGASEFFQMMQRRRTIRDFSDRAVPKTWLDALAALGTDWKKPFLETAPWLITVFAQPFRILPDGTRSPTYYPLESVGIATGLLVIALHSCGLAALTHTPSPMGFLNRILGRRRMKKHSFSSSSASPIKTRLFLISPANRSNKSAHL
jgi:hypothetical protein